MSNQPQVIFISCGQFSEAEKNLGKQVAQLVRDLTPFEPYFAEYQSTFDGLTQNIFTSIYSCVGFIGIMHHRGIVATPNGDRIRGSVWVEQEIAIAAFLQQVLKKNLHVSAYMQKGIALEGVREKLLLNPISFESESEVLGHLKEVLPKWTPLLLNSTESPQLDIKVNHYPKQIQKERIVYGFFLTIINAGQMVLIDYRVQVEFPSAFLADTWNPHWEEKQMRTDTHRFLRLTHENYKRTVLYPDDKLNIADLDYYLTEETDTDEAKKATVRVRAYSGVTNLLDITFPMADLFKGQYP